MSRIPGPALCKLSWVYFSYYDVMLKRNEKILQWHQKYGPIVCIRPTEVSFASPSLMREIYGASGKYDKSAFFDQFTAYGERAVFSVRPSWIHRRRRMAIASFFSKTSINNPIVENSIRERVNALFQQIDIAVTENSPLDIYPMLNYFAFDNVTRLLYGRQHCSHTIESDTGERTILSGLKKAQLWGPFHFNYPLLFSCLDKFLAFAGIHRGFLIAEHQLEAWTQRRVVAALVVAGSDNDYTLLGRMNGANDIDGSRMSSNYIAEELLDNTNAAQETVTVALTYVVYHLGRNPEWQSNIREELLALPKLADGYPSFANIDDAPVLDSFIREVYRVNPGSSGRAERIVPAGGKEYAGFYLPSGTRVSASTVALHHNPSVFSSAAAFQPQRWRQADTERLREMNASFIPFGYGARICLGMAFATMQIKLLIACLCITYRITVDPNSKTSEESMRQVGTQDAIPRGLRCDVLLASYKAS